MIKTGPQGRNRSRAGSGLPAAYPGKVDPALRKVDHADRIERQNCGICTRPLVRIAQLPTRTESALGSASASSRRTFASPGS